MWRIEIRGDLIAVSALHIGSDRDGPAVDAEQLVDGMNRVVIPGTTLAGVLRAAARRTGTEHLWGSLEAASAVTVFDAWARGPVQMEVRDSTAIDRITGTSAEGHLHSRQVVPAGTRFRLRAALEGASITADTVTHVQDLVALLGGAGITVGAATTRGLGHVRLVDPTITCLALDRADSVDAVCRTVLTGGDDVPVEPARSTVPAGCLRITVPWRPLGAVMSRVEIPGGVPNAYPLATADIEDGNPVVRLVLPGSSVKGALRSHAERIVRTATNTELSDTTTFLEQMRATNLPGIADLFGTAHDGSISGHEGNRGALRVHEVTTAVTIDAETWADLISPKADVGGAQDDDAQHRALAERVDQLNTTLEPTGLWFDYVARTAVDRWSGGVVDGALFTTVEPHATDTAVWRPLVLDLDVGRLQTGTRTEVALALLLLILSDLARDRLPLGFGTTRGLGSIRVDREKVSIETAADVSLLDAVGDGHTRTCSLTQLLNHDPTIDGLDEAWTSAIGPVSAR